jgi:hypothetical protein
MMTTVRSITQSMFTKMSKSRIVQSALSGMNRNLSNVWTKAGVVFVAVVISDFVWAKYMAAVSAGAAVAAANWAVLVIALGAYLVVSYVEDKRMVAPAAIGAWLGTYLAI